MQKRHPVVSTCFLLAALAVLALAAPRAMATSDVRDAWESVYPSSTLVTTYSCQVCHSGGSNFNPYGQAISDEWANSGYTITAQQAIEAVEPLDSDGDGFTNIAEITENTLPGDETSHPATDMTPPSAPTGLAATPVSSSRIDLTWTASTDNVGVTGYRVYRGATLVGSPTATSYSDTGLTASTSYSYTVKATDAAANLSAASNTATTSTLAASGSVSGQVKDKVTSAVIAGATVILRMGGVMKATVTTNASGVYLANTGLATGTYAVSASKTGYITQTKTGISVTQGATTYVNFALAPISIKGQVKQAGTTTAIAGATVAAYQADVLKATATTSASGVYEIGGLAAGSYTVIASKVGYVKQKKLNIAVSGGSIAYVNFNLAVSGKLKGQVKDKVSGLPIVGATIVARSGGVVVASGVTTSPYGIYEIASDLPAGTYVVGASKTGYLGQTRKDIVVTAGATTYVNFSLQAQ